MKLSAALVLASVGTSSAFSGPRTAQSARASPLLAGFDDDDLRTVSAPRGTAGKPIASSNSGIGQSPLMAGPDASPKRRVPLKSQAIPFINAPRFLDGSLAGDVGFDPMGWADSYENLANYREAEVKHGRLAMLAAVGWPLSELWDRPIANMLGMEPVLDETNRAPSVLNGGLGRVSIVYWAGCLALAGALDAYGSYVAPKNKGYTAAGDLGFDPLNFYPRRNDEKSEKRRMELRLSEIKHGRIAMIAITAFAFQEFASGTAVVDHASLFFKPIWQVLYEASQGPSVTDFEPATLAPYMESASTAAPVVREAVEAVAPAVTDAPSIVAPAVTEAPSIVAPAVTEAPSIVAPAVTEVPSVAAPIVNEAVAPAVQEAATAVPAQVAPGGGLADELAAKQARIADLQSTISQYEAQAASSLKGDIADASRKIADLEQKLAQIEALVK